MGQRKKMRIAIFTITSGLNYGQRLQNYALQTVLQSFSDEAHEVTAETVLSERWGMDPLSYFYPLEKSMGLIPFSRWRKQGMSPRDISLWVGNKALRHEAFQQFDQESIRKSAIRIRRENLQQTETSLREMYDWGVAGSDQIWNVHFSGVSGFDFAACMPQGRRVAYAASFGVREIPKEVAPSYRTLLQGLTQISVREDAGAALVQELSGREATVVPDPTMLLPREHWKFVMKKPVSLELPASYLLVYDLRMDAGAGLERVEAIAQEKGLSLLVLPGDNRIEDASFAAVGPAEFVYLIAHATAVVTDSFHGACFSLLFGKPFLGVVRPVAASWMDMSARFDTLLSAYGLEQRRVAQAEEITAERLFADDMGDVPRRIRERRKIGTAFLENALPGVGGKLRLNSVALVRRDRCTGCSACAAACPQAAITMKHESRGGGFIYPSVDRAACRDCGRCLAICPACHPMDPPAGVVRAEEDGDSAVAAVLAAAKDDAVRRKSSSGAMFPLLARQALAAGGVVIGAALGGPEEGWRVRHEAAEDEAGLSRLLRSKYVQSDKGDSFRQTADFLRAGREVLFSGTGCEVQGLLRYLSAIRQDTAHLMTVDIICHGTPSPALWQKYMELRLSLDGQRAGDVVGVNFRDKSAGWHRSACLSIDYRNGGRHVSQGDLFMQLFLNNLCLRGSCYHCPARSRLVRDADASQDDAWQAWRPSDLTIGDFWGIDQTNLKPLDDDKGLSLVFAHTPKGRRLLQALKSSGAAMVQEIALRESFLRRTNPNIFTDVARPEERDAVLQAVGNASGAELLAALEKAVPRLFS